MFPTTLTSGTRHPNDTSLSIKDVRIRALFALAFKGRNQGMSLADLEDVDALFDQEKFVVENGELVGTTATINEDEITQTTGKPLEGVDCDFDACKASIIEASKATSLLFVQSKDSKGRLIWNFATAFFVGPNLLLTAGHAALDPPDAVSTERWLSLPGTPILHIDQVTSHYPCAIRCSVVETNFKAGAAISKDIAILSSNAFESRYYLNLCADDVPLNATIDVVGYPGEKTAKWLKERHPDLKSIVAGVEAGAALLPTGKLVVTRGIVAESRVDTTSYIISTCPGLSGGCMLYNGKAHGVHVGDSLKTKQPVEWGSAVSFQSKKTTKFLRKHKLM